MSRENSKSSFPKPAIATQSSQPEGLNLNKVDLSRDGIQGDVVVSKGEASTFVSKRPKGGEDK